MLLNLKRSPTHHEVADTEFYPLIFPISHDLDFWPLLVAEDADPCIGLRVTRSDQARWHRAVSPPCVMLVKLLVKQRNYRPLSSSQIPAKCHQIGFCRLVNSDVGIPNVICYAITGCFNGYLLDLIYTCLYFNSPKHTTRQDTVR